MSQDTAFGKADLITYIKVEKKVGTIYYKVVDEKTIEISELEYFAANKKETN